MSLINQMLKDLERRGAKTSDAHVVNAETIRPKLDVTSTLPPSQSKIRLPLIKVGGIMVLLAGGTYLWMQSTIAQSHNSDVGKMIASTTNKPNPITRLAPPASIDSRITSSASAADIPIKWSPLFETELKYNSSAIQPVDTKIQKEKVITQLIPAVVPEKSLTPVEPEVVTTPEKSAPLILEHPAKPLSKTNTDNAAIGKQIRPDQKSGNYYRQALSYLQQGRVSEAQANLAMALEVNPANQDARQTLAGLLLDNKRHDEARATLAAGLTIAPEQNDFRMALARLQIETGDLSGAINTLEQGLSYANNNADYHSFLATLLQRAGRHEEAINYYTTALSLNSIEALSSNNRASVLIGLGISLQAVGKLEKSQEAFTRAQSSTTLSPDLSIFVEQRIKQISQRLQN